MSYKHTHTCISTHMHTCICVYTWTHRHTLRIHNIYTNICTHLYKHTNIYTHLHLTRPCDRWCKGWLCRGMIVSVTEVKPCLGSWAGLHGKCRLDCETHHLRPLVTHWVRNRISWVANSTLYQDKLNRIESIRVHSRVIWYIYVYMSNAMQFWYEVLFWLQPVVRNVWKMLISRMN